MDKPFPAYRGDQPFVFVCYAHGDVSTVYPELQRLRDHGVNIWYDEGISPGEQWTEEIAAAIRNAFKVLYFVSKNSVASRHCRNEMQFASSRDKEMVVVYLEPTSLPDGLELSIGTVQALFKHELTLTDFRERLRDALVGSPKPAHVITERSRAVDHSFRSSLMVSAGLVLMLSLVTGAWWYFGGEDEPVPQPDVVADPPLTAIAVMPFQDLSPSGDHAWLANGMTEELMQSLSRIQELRIPGRNSTTLLKSQGADIRSIRDSLDVGSLVEGSVTKIDDEMLVVARWIRGSDEQTLWSGRYQESSANIFSIQRAIAVNIAEAIRTELGSEIGNVVSFLKDARYETTDVRAWELHQKANELIFGIRDPDKLREARVLLHNALELDPNYAHARSALIVTDFLNPQRRLSDARSMYQQGVRTSGVMGILIEESIRQWDYQSAEELFAEAIAASPSAGILMIPALTIARAQGRLDEALEVASRGARLDPLWHVTSMNLGLAQLETGQIELGIKTLQDAIRSAENAGQGYFAPGVYVPLAVALHMSGRAEDAVKALVRGMPDAEHLMLQGYDDGGWEGINLALGHAFLEAPHNFCAATRYADAREPDMMYECLELWLVGDRGELARFLPAHISFDAYRQEPRFQDMAKKFRSRMDQSAGSFSLGSSQEPVAS